jgi:large subunit ribosomal protein L23
VFEVAPRSTKAQIRTAVEKLFNVRVVSVNTVVVKGKKKKQGRFVGFRPNWKKAIVKIAAGQSIDKFGEV